MEMFRGPDTGSSTTHLDPQDIAVDHIPEFGIPSELEALFNTDDFVDLSSMSPSMPPNLDSSISNIISGPHGQPTSSSLLGVSTLNDFAAAANGFTNGTNDFAPTFDFGGFGGEMLAGEGMDSVSDGLKTGENQGLCVFMLCTSVERLTRRSAAAILSLLEEGSFDYGSIFTDQAPLPTDLDFSPQELKVTTVGESYMT